jgi:hypothetical protein
MTDEDRAKHNHGQKGVRASLCIPGPVVEMARMHNAKDYPEPDKIDNARHV